MDAEQQLQGSERRCRLLRERVEQLRSECATSEADSQAQQLDVQAAMQRARLQQAASAVSDAHVWWAYVWHALKERQRTADQQQVSSKIGAQAEAALAAGCQGQGQAQHRPGDYEYRPTTDSADGAKTEEDLMDAAVHESKLKGNLRLQAIEIAKARQVLIWAYIAVTVIVAFTLNFLRLKVLNPCSCDACLPACLLWNRKHSSAS